MKTQFTTPFRKYSTATFAALSLAALPLATYAKDKDKDDDDHPKGKKEHMEKHHDDHAAKTHEEKKHDEIKHEAKEKHDDAPRVVHKDKDGPPRKEGPHKGDPVVIHEGKGHPDRPDKVVVHDRPDKVIVHDRPDKVIVHDKPGPDHVVVRPGPVVHHDGPVVHHHRHPGYVLRLADGWRGHGWYYGPPTVRYFEESTPDVVYYSTREEAPQEIVEEQAPAPAESRDAAIQRALTEKGYYNGAIDGELGPMSHRAIAKYQADHDMKPTGEVTEKLLIDLGIN